MRCSKCGSENRVGRKFCTNCGTPLLAACPKCGAAVEPDEKFCGECGTALDDAATAAADGNQSVTASGGGERRHLTILFCDLVGSVTLTSQLDPEEWRATVADYQRAASAEITRFGGEVMSYVGDGIMAFFGYPIAHDNDAERAARAGLAILDEIAKLNEHQTGRPKLSVRIGIDSGPVVVGTGAGQAVDAFGDAANIAARVQAAAESDTVVVTDATHRLISGLFVVEDRGPQTLKGIERPVRLYRVVRASGVRGRFEAAAAAGGLTPFVGREDELRSLVSRWERAREGDGQVAVIIGEPGIGKSRLVRRFHETIAGTPHTWLEAGAGAFFQNTPFYPVTETLRQFNSAGRDPIADLVLRLDAAGLKPAEAIPLIAPLLNLSLPPEYPPSPLTPEQQRRRLLATLVEWLLGAARTQPLVSVIEDLHWADPSTLALIQLLVEQGTKAPVLLLYTARPEFPPPWPLRAHHTQLTLNRLSTREVRTMVHEVAGSRALSDETVAAVIERTGGVPLFVEELTRSVLESNDATRTLRAIPVTLHDSLMARLDVLGLAKEVAQVGSVIGNEFSYELLQTVQRIAEPELQSALRNLTDAELLYVRGIPPEATYQFKHALIRDAAYGAVLKSRRRELHKLVAQTIENQFVGVKESNPEVLARHWTEAGVPQKAIEYLRLAGDKAARRSANREAIVQFEAALRILETLPDTPQRNHEELKLRVKLRDPLMASTGYTSREVQQLCERVRELCQGMPDGPEIFAALAGLISVHLNRGELRTALELAQQMLSVAERSERTSFLMWAHYAMGFALHGLGCNVSAREQLEQSIALYDRRRGGAYGFVQDPGPTCLLTLAHTLYDVGYPDQALSRAEAGLRLARELAHPFTLAWVLHSYSIILLRRGDISGATSPCEEGIAIRIKHGFALEDTMEIRGWLLAASGRAREGVASIHEGIADARTISRYHGHGLAQLAKVLGLAGRVDEGLAVTEEALATTGSSERPFLNAWFHQLKGDLLSQLGVLEEAEHSYRMSLSLVRGQDARDQELITTTHLARLLAKRGRHDEARKMVAEIYNWFTEGFDTADLKDAKALLDELGD